MTRKKIKHEQIESESKRNTVFKHRLDGLLKKANELSILCGVEIGVMIEKPNENQTLMWPSPQIFWERLHKFLNFSDLEKTKKMVMHDKYLEQRLRDETKLLQKFQKKNEEKELHDLMNGLFIQGKDINQLDLQQLSTLHSFADELLEKLKKRNEELSYNQQYVQPLPLSVPPPPHFRAVAAGTPVGDYAGETSIFEDLRSDRWFMETMLDGQDGVNGIMGFPAGQTHGMDQQPFPPPN